MRLARNCFTFASETVSRFGELVGSDTLVYNPGIFLSFHRAAVRNAPKFSDTLLKEFPGITSIADVGCGSGGYAAEYVRRKLRVVACERSNLGRKWAIKQGVDCQYFDLAFPEKKVNGLPVDLAYSLEVAEHIPSTLSDAFVQFLCDASSTVVLTAAHPGQGGQGHINEQPKSYWIEKFEQRGFRYDQAASERMAAELRRLDAAGYLLENMMVFRKA